MIKPVDYEPSQNFGDNPTSILPADHWLIQRFGNYQPDGHTGVDYPCPAGTPVKAVTSGTVLHVGWFGGSYLDNPYWIAPGFAGYCYVVDHGSFVGIYAHCLDGGARVKVGQRVTEGQVLGPSGNTGGSTGDHLHFETLPDGWVVNSRMYGRVNPTQILGRVTTQSTTTTTPKDWFDMATEAQLRKVIQGELAKDNPWTFKNPNLERDDAYALLRASRTFAVKAATEAAATNAQISGLVGALKAVASGEKFDEAKLLSSIQAAAAAGIKQGIDSIESTTTTTVNIAKEATANG